MSCCDLPVQVLVVDLLWGLVSECRVKTLSIVAEFYIPGNILAGVFTGRVDGAVDPFDFYGGIEGFGEGVVEAYSGGPDRLPDAEEVRRGREGRAGILCTAIGVEYCALGERVIPGGHGQRVDGEFGAEMVGYGVSDAGFCVAVDDRGEIHPALPGLDVGDIAHHFLAGGLGSEIPIHQIRNRAGIAG